MAVGAAHPWAFAVFPKAVEEPSEAACVCFELFFFDGLLSQRVAVSDMNDWAMIRVELNWRIRLKGEETNHRQHVSGFSWSTVAESGTGQV